MSLYKSVQIFTLLISLFFLLSSNEARSQSKKPDQPTKGDSASKNKSSLKKQTPEPKKIAVPEEYVKLATTMSNTYVNYRPGSITDLVEKELSDGVPFYLQLGFVADNLKTAKRPAIVAAVKNLNEGVIKSKVLYEDFKKKVGEGDQRQAETNDAIDRGEFKRTVERTEFEKNSDGTTRQVTKTEVEDDTVMLFVFGDTMNGVRKDSLYREFCRKRSREMEKVRLAAWESLIPRLKNFYTNETALGNGITFNLTPFNERTGERPRLTIRNTGKSTLTNLTIIMEMVHFTSAPETTSSRAYFISKLDDGQTIELAPDLHFNRPGIDEFLKGRPEEAIPDYLRENDEKLGDFYQFRRTLLPKPWSAENHFKDLAGLVQIKHTIYTEQGNQPDRVVNFSETAEVGANMELRSLFRAINLSMNRTKEPCRTHQEAFAKIPFNWGERVARRLPKFLPADSEALKLAKLALVNPEQFCQEFSKQQELAIAKTLTPNSLYRGIHEKQHPSVPGENISEAPIAMRIDAFDPKNGSISVTYFDPTKPEHFANRVGSLVKLNDGIVEINIAGRTRDLAPPTRRKQPPSKLGKTEAFLAYEALTKKYSWSQFQDLTPSKQEQHEAAIAEAKAKVNAEIIAKAKAEFVDEPVEQRDQFYNAMPALVFQLTPSGLHGSSTDPRDYQNQLTLKVNRDPALKKSLALAVKKDGDLAAAAVKLKLDKAAAIAKKDKEFCAVLMASELNGGWKLGYDRSEFVFTKNSEGLINRSRDLINPEKYQGRVTLKFEDFKPETREFAGILTSEKSDAKPLRRAGIVTIPSPGQYVLEFKSLLSDETTSKLDTHWRRGASKQFTLGELDLATAHGEIILEITVAGANGKLLPSYINPKNVWLDFKLERNR